MRAFLFTILIFTIFGQAFCIVEKIKHVIVLMLENRSFDHMLGFLKKQAKDLEGCLPSAPRCSCPLDPTMTGSPQTTVSDDAVFWTDVDPSHSTHEVTRQIYSVPHGDELGNPPNMDGFISSLAQKYKNDTLAPEIMRCFSTEHVPVLVNLATEFVVIDGWFSSVPGCTMPNRAFASSGTAHGMNTNNVETIAKGLPQKTIFRQLEEMGLDYRVYFEDVPSVLMFKDMRHRDARPKIRPMKMFYEDVAAGTLPEYVWLEPGYFDSPLKAASDMHPGHDVAEGEELLRQVYESIRSSPIWNETVFIITFDEHGGFFDHVPPPSTNVPPPDSIKPDDDPFDYTRLGVRVPTIVVSPWVEKGAIVHAQDEGERQFDHTSIIATVVHKIFASKPPHPSPQFLTARDAWSRTFENLFSRRSINNNNTNENDVNLESNALSTRDVKDQPRVDCPLTMPVPQKHRVLQPNRGGVPLPDRGTVPISDFQRELVAMVAGASSRGNWLFDIEGWTEEHAIIFVEDILKKFFEQEDIDIDESKNLRSN